MKSRTNLFLAIVVVLTGLSIWRYVETPYNLGIDIQGGIRMIYTVSQTEESKDDETRSLARDRASAIKVLVRRADRGMGVTEATVQAKGVDQIIVELPGFTDIEQARIMMGSTAKLKGYHATNITTTFLPRPYTIGREDNEGGAPVVYFNNFRGEEIAPGTEAYDAIIADWTLIIEGTDLSNAQVQRRGNNTVIPEFTFSTEGAAKMKKWSTSVLGQDEYLAFVIDGDVLSIAPLERTAILSDKAIINGSFDVDYVRRLTTLLREGALDVNLKPESEQTVDASIGAGALDKMVIAGISSFVLICLFLIVYYSLPGFIAAIAMVLYGLFTITTLKLLGATFSMAAIAAFILSVGMAVDANVLVFERIKEELRSGRELLAAVDLGFKRALSAIIDSNACTILTCIVLWSLGTGAVKGFATTLIWGVLISFFTAFTVTRTLLISSMKMGIGKDPKYYAMKRNWFGEKLEEGAQKKPLDILGKSKTWFALSGLFIVIGLGFIGAGGIKKGVEFLGGYEGIYTVSGGLTADQIDANLAENGFPEANVKLGTAEDEDGVEYPIAYITIPLTANIVYPEGTEELDKNTIAKEQIAAAAELEISESDSFTVVGAKIQQEMVTNAYLGVAIASLLIILYLTIRFGVALGGMKNGIKFGLSAIAALLHDVLFVLGTAAFVGMIMGWEISALFITAMLTVIGFSVHDSIVIFDRIRENLRRPHRGETFEHLVNKSITQSVARSINTSVTAFVPLVILVIWGTTVPELKFMCLTMAAGIAIGTYSSIFNASPILWLWNKSTMKRHGEQAGLMLEAQREAKLRARIAMDNDPRVYKDDTGDTFGQVKRKQSAVDKAAQDIDTDDI